MGCFITGIYLLCSLVVVVRSLGFEPFWPMGSPAIYVAVGWIAFAFVLMDLLRSQTLRKAEKAGWSVVLLVVSPLVLAVMPYLDARRGPYQVIDVRPCQAHVALAGIRATSGRDPVTQLGFGESAGQLALLREGGAATHLLIRMRMSQRFATRAKVVNRTQFKLFLNGADVVLTRNGSEAKALLAERPCAAGVTAGLETLERSYRLERDLDAKEEQTASFYLPEMLPPGMAITASSSRLVSSMEKGGGTGTSSLESPCGTLSLKLRIEQSFTQGTTRWLVASASGKLETTSVLGPVVYSYSGVQMHVSWPESVSGWVVHEEAVRDLGLVERSHEFRCLVPLPQGEGALFLSLLGGPKVPVRMP